MDRLSVINYELRPDFFAAQEMGFFEEEGLDVAIERVTFAPDHNRGMAEGRWDFTLSSSDTMIARTTRDGTDYVIFMNAERGVEVRLVGAPETRRLTDIVGKTMAGDPGDSNFDLHRRKIMRDHGIGEDQYEVAIIGATPERYEALLAGDVVAAMLSGKYFSQAFDHGCHILAAASDHVPAYPVFSGWTLRSWAESHEELLVRFIRAFVKGSDWALDPANREAALDMTMRRNGIGRAQAEGQLSRVIPKAAIDPPGLARVASLRAEMGVYDPPFDPVERFYDTRYWCKATGLPAPAPYGVPDMAALQRKPDSCGCLV